MIRIAIATAALLATTAASATCPDEIGQNIAMINQRMTIVTVTSCKEVSGGDLVAYTKEGLHLIRRAGDPYWWDVPPPPGTYRGAGGGKPPLDHNPLALLD